MISIDLTHRACLVTGGSRGIGRAIAITLAHAGAAVAVGYVHGRSQADTTAQLCGHNSFSLQGDVSNPSDCRRMVQAVVDSFGRFDILVNNAGILTEESVEMGYEDWLSHWRDTFDTNLMGAVNMSYWAIRHMKERGSGKIINISSRSAFRGETECMAYAASKAAMVNFTRSIARAFAKSGVLSYTVAPGFIEAGMALQTIAVQGDEIRAQIPSGRIGSADDVANVVLFLASDLSNYLTGSTIDVNGGSYLH